MFLWASSPTTRGFYRAQLVIQVKNKFTVFAAYKVAMKLHPQIEIVAENIPVVVGLQPKRGL